MQKTREIHDRRYTDEQIRAVATMLLALGDVPNYQRIDTMALVVRILIDDIEGRGWTAAFRNLMHKTGLDR